MTTFYSRVPVEGRSDGGAGERGRRRVHQADPRASAGRLRDIHVYEHRDLQQEWGNTMSNHSTLAELLVSCNDPRTSAGFLRDIHQECNKTLVLWRVYRSTCNNIDYIVVVVIYLFVLWTRMVPQLAFTYCEYRPKTLLTLMRIWSQMQIGTSIAGRFCLTQNFAAFRKILPQ